MIKLELPLTSDKISRLKANDRILLSGIIYTFRDAGHKKMTELIINGECLPIDLTNQTIYYVGACPKKTNQPIGSCGPTTSMRVDDYTPILLDNGLKGMIGKGERSEQVRKCIIENKCVYFAAIGGAGALYASKVKSSKLIAFENLLSEALFELEICDFPVIVAIDSFGNSIYQDDK